MKEKIPLEPKTPEELDQLVEDTKEEIATIFRATLEEQNLSIRKLAHSIGMQHPQVMRVTSKQNYTISKLVKILDAAGLRLVIEKKD